MLRFLFIYLFQIYPVCIEAGSNSIIIHDNSACSLVVKRTNGGDHVFLVKVFLSVCMHGLRTEESKIPNIIRLKGGRQIGRVSILQFLYRLEHISLQVWCAIRFNGVSLKQVP